MIFDRILSGFINFKTKSYSWGEFWFGDFPSTPILAKNLNCHVQNLWELGKYQNNFIHNSKFYLPYLSILIPKLFAARQGNSIDGICFSLTFSKIEIGNFFCDALRFLCRGKKMTCERFLLSAREVLLKWNAAFSLDWFILYSSCPTCLLGCFLNHSTFFWNRFKMQDDANHFKTNFWLKDGKKVKNIGQFCKKPLKIRMTRILSEWFAIILICCDFYQLQLKVIH